MWRSPYGSNGTLRDPTALRRATEPGAVPAAWSGKDGLVVTGSDVFAPGWFAGALAARALGDGSHPRSRLDPLCLPARGGVRPFELLRGDAASGARDQVQGSRTSVLYSQGIHTHGCGSSVTPGTASSRRGGGMGGGSCARLGRPCSPSSPDTTGIDVCMYDLPYWQGEAALSCLEGAQPAAHHRGSPRTRGHQGGRRRGARGPGSAGSAGPCSWNRRRGGPQRGGEAFAVAFVELADGDAFPVHTRRGHISDTRVQR
jgi:hypothetical protein